MPLPGAGVRHLRKLESQAGFDQAEQEQREEALAHHGLQLRALAEGKPVANVWGEHLIPILDKLHARAGRDILALTGEARVEAIGYQKALEDFVTVVTGDIQLGQRAASAIARRRLQEAERAERREATGM